MKKTMVILMAVSLFAGAMPVYAMDHSATHDPADVECARNCDLLLKDCSKEVDTIQQRIKKIQTAINKDGADQAKVEEVKRLKVMLDDANETLRNLEKH
jgi:hypothetical protein